MISIQVEDIKKFMNELLIGKSFDDFCLYEAVIKTAVMYEVDGRINREFFDSEEESENRDYIQWSDEKEMVYGMIRGKKLPLTLKIVFIASDSIKTGFITKNSLNMHPDDIKALNLNIYYDRNALNITTGVSLKTFSLDKTVERAWDETVQKFISTRI